MFGKLMSISDDLMWQYYTLLSFRPMSEIDLMKPKWRWAATRATARWLWRRRSSRVSTARPMPRRRSRTSTTAPGRRARRHPAVSLEGAPLGIAQLLKQANLVPSTSEANRNIEQGGVKIDGAVVSDKATKVAPAPTWCRWASAASRA
jgi:tyrosyl-tRNA synthetase